MTTREIKFSIIPEMKSKAMRETGQGCVPLVTSIFAGTGGSSEGYRLAGIKELLAVEFDKHAVKCFGLNFPEVPVESWDIMSINGKTILNRIDLKPGELDHFDASPPCQALSIANTKAKADDPKNELFLKTIRLIAEAQPKCFLIENVTGLLKGKNKKFFAKVRKLLNKLNYTWKYTIAKAEEYGVPQARRRVIIIGVRTDICKQLDNPRFVPLPDLANVEKMALKYILPGVAAFSPGQFKDKIHLANKPFCTITKTASQWLYDMDGTRRKPTIEELLKLSSFRKDFKLMGSFIQKWARIGNAVPPELIRAFAENIKNEILTEHILKYSDTIDTISKCSEISRMYECLGFQEFKFINIKGCMM